MRAVTAHDCAVSDSPAVADPILFGDEHGDHLSITVLERMHPGCWDFWDGNWLVTRIAICAGGFAARFEAALRAEELRGLATELDDLKHSRTRTVVLESMEEWLSLAVRRDAEGGLIITGQAKDMPETGPRNRLIFNLAGLDESELDTWIELLAACEKEFPVLDDGGGR